MEDPEYRRLGDTQERIIPVELGRSLSTSPARDALR
jgi:hypothetical protein